MNSHDTVACMGLGDLDHHWKSVYKLERLGHIRMLPTANHGLHFIHMYTNPHARVDSFNGREHLVFFRLSMSIGFTPKLETITLG